MFGTQQKLFFFRFSQLTANKHFFRQKWFYVSIIIVGQNFTVLTNLFRFWLTLCYKMKLNRTIFASFTKISFVSMGLDDVVMTRFALFIEVAAIRWRKWQTMKKKSFWFEAEINVKSHHEFDYILRIYSIVWRSIVNINLQNKLIFFLF